MVVSRELQTPSHHPSHSLGATPQLASLPSSGSCPYGIWGTWLFFRDLPGDSGTIQHRRHTTTPVRPSFILPSSLCCSMCSGHSRAPVCLAGSLAVGGPPSPYIYAYNMHMHTDGPAAHMSCFGSKVVEIEVRPVREAPSWPSRRAAEIF